MLLPIFDKKTQESQKAQKAKMAQKAMVCKVLLLPILREIELRVAEVLLLPIFGKKNGLLVSKHERNTKGQKDQKGQKATVCKGTEVLLLPIFDKKRTFSL